MLLYFSQASLYIKVQYKLYNCGVLRELFGREYFLHKPGVVFVYCTEHTGATNAFLDEHADPPLEHSGCVSACCCLSSEVYQSSSEER